MALIYRDLEDTDPGLRTIAGSILFSQTLDIGQMIQMLRDDRCAGGRRDGRGDGAGWACRPPTTRCRAWPARSSSSRSPRRAAPTADDCSSS